jgi:hypothetical protein
VDSESSKRRRVGSNSSDTESNSFPTNLEVLGLNGEWNTAETIPSIIGETCNLTLPKLNAFIVFCNPCSVSSTSEVSNEDGDCTIQQRSETVDLEKVIESTPLTRHSDGDYKYNNNVENNCDESFSWLINFNVGSLFNAAEVQHDHVPKGRVKETTCSGMYRKYRNYPSDIHFGFVFYIK